MCFVTDPPAALVGHGGVTGAGVGHEGSPAAVDTTKFDSGAEPGGVEAAIDMIIMRSNPEKWGEFGGRVITMFADDENHSAQRRLRTPFFRPQSTLSQKIQI